jgi:hypothetical protein
MLLSPCDWIRVFHLPVGGDARRISTALRVLM